MEILFVVGSIWFVLWLVGRIRGSRSDGNRLGSSPPAAAPDPRRAEPPAVPKSKDVYRPRASAPNRAKIVFQPVRSDGASADSTPTQAALEGLHDAFTGAPLNLALGLHQCSNCKVYYHSSSMEVLRAENGSRCVACGSASIISLTGAQARSSAGRDHRPDVVTLANFRDHFDRVVTFEGRVHMVRVSTRGTDYAVMFENKSWTRGLKLVFFKGSVRTVGGPTFIHGLEGKTVRVRGLLVNHDQFGPEIIITERDMILAIAS